MSPRARAVAAGVALAVVLVVLGLRAEPQINVPGRVEPSRWVLQDFRDAVYYPVVAFLDGRNPYDPAAQARTYPVGQSFPPYLPVTLLAHLPFGLLPHAEAGDLYLAVVVGLTAVLAALAIGGAGLTVTVSGVFGLTALLLLSRPGHMNLLLGQVTVQVAIGTYIALRWARTRPLLAGLGLALATLKPTYGVPLAALMLLGLGEVRAVVTGVVVSAALSLVALMPLAYAAGGIVPFVNSVRGSAAAFSGENTSNAWSSFARIDVVALLARGLGHVPAAWMGVALEVAVMAAALVALNRLRGDHSPPTHQLAVGLICLTVLVGSYHQAYDALLLAQPGVALAAGRWGRGVVAPAALRWTILALLAVPGVNYLATGTVTSELTVGAPAWIAITLMNPAALLTAWALHLRVAWRAPVR